MGKDSSEKKIRAIITGTTGMVGEGVLHECLLHPDVEQVLVINRRSCGITHPKLKEVLHDNFMDIAALETQLDNYNACFFCLGVSSIGMKQEEYSRLTYDLTLHVATMLSSVNPEMVFCYVSGVGTDRSERGRSMWARVKGRTENDLLKLPFRKSYMFRPGYIHPTKGLNNTHLYYYAISWMFPVLKYIFPSQALRLREMGMAMIHTVHIGYPQQILEIKDIQKLAKG